jgi:hypothetical protein
MKNKNVVSDERSKRLPRQSGAVSTLHVVLIASGILIIAGAAYFWGFGPEKETARDSNDLSGASEAASAQQEPRVEPEMPPPAEPENIVVPAESLPPEPAAPSLPPLNESDDAVRDALAAIPLGTAGQQYLLSTNIIERSSSTVYLMAQGEVPYKLIPIARPKTAFPISDDGLKVTADALGFSRYDALTAWLRQLDIPAITEALAWLTPLFREAWGFYGEAPETFDAAVLSVLDAIITTPEIDLTEARLLRKEAVWIFEDPAIEALPPLQKQVLRMGPDNALVIKAVAGQTRDLWVNIASQE